jgi:hypothetical protein
MKERFAVFSPMLWYAILAISLLQAENAANPPDLEHPEPVALQIP